MSGWQEYNSRTDFTSNPDYYSRALPRWKYVSRNLFRELAHEEELRTNLLDIGSRPNSIFSEYIATLKTNAPEISITADFVDPAYRNPTAKLSALVSIAKHFKQNGKGFDRVLDFYQRFKQIQDFPIDEDIHNLFVEGSGVLEEIGIKINFHAQVAQEYLEVNQIESIPMTGITSFINYHTEAETLELLEKISTMTEKIVFVNYQTVGRTSHGSVYKEDKASNESVIGYLENQGYSFNEMGRDRSKNIAGGIFSR